MIDPAKLQTAQPCKFIVGKSNTGEVSIQTIDSTNGLVLTSFTMGKEDATWLRDQLSLILSDTGKDAKSISPVTLLKNDEI